MKLPFVGQAYQARSLNVDAQRCVNLYLEADTSSSRAPLALYGTPGTILRATLGAARGVRGCIVAGGFSWWVSGATVYKMTSAYVVSTVGTLNSTSGPVSLASNGIEILIVDGVNGYIITLSTEILLQIADPDFPNGVAVCTYQDSYFIVTSDGSQVFYISDLLAGSSWVGTEFASAEGSPDLLVSMLSDHRELWLFGTNTTEVWVNTGNAEFPFERSGNTMIETGCAAPFSVAKMDNAIFWVGADDRGTGVVYRASGYTPARISTHAIEHAIQGYQTVADAVGFSYQQEGHVFYVLNFPSGNATWVYDAATGAWHERVWRNPNIGSLNRWRGNCYAFFNNKHLIGDWQNGKIYELDLDTYTDNTDPIIRLRSTQCFEKEQREIFYRRLQVDLEVGIGLQTGQGASPLMMMRWSNDGGHTWSNQKTATVGATGQYGARCQYHQLGSGRNRVWEVSMTDPVKPAILGADIEFEVGSW